MQFLMNRLYKNDQTTSEKGFTLIELITVILLLGIIGVMGSEVITTSFKGFAQTDDAMELFEEGKLAMMRMEREIHHMVPNAIDDPNDAPSIRFGLIDVNTLYSTVSPIITGQYTPATNQKIKDLCLEMLPIGGPPFLSICNTTWDDFTSNLITERKLYDITAINAPPGSMTLDKKVIDGDCTTTRYYPVQKAVGYYLIGSFLYRAETPVTLAPVNFITTLDAAPAYPLLTNIDALTFNYSPASLTSNALVSINFTLKKNDITLHFHKEIQVRNVP